MGACPHRHTNGMVKYQMDGEYRKSRHDTESNGVGGGMPPPYDGVIRHSHTPHFDYYRSTFPGVVLRAAHLKAS